MATVFPTNFVWHHKKKDLTQLYIDILERGHKMIDARWEGEVFVITTESMVYMLQDISNSQIRPTRTKYIIAKK